MVWKTVSWWSWRFFVICPPRKLFQSLEVNKDYQNYIILLETNSRLGPWWTPVINWPLDFPLRNRSPKKVLHLREALRREGGWNWKWRSALRGDVSEVTILEQCSKLETLMAVRGTSRWYNLQGIIYFISHYNEYIMIMDSKPNPLRNKGLIFCLISGKPTVYKPWFLRESVWV